MKNCFLILLGVIVGVTISVVGLVVFASYYSRNYGDNTYSTDGSPIIDGLTLFEIQEDEMSDSSYKVFQVLNDDCALARAEDENIDGLYLGKVVLLVSENGKSYYDEQIIKRGKGKRFVQIGLYKYSAYADSYYFPFVSKTIPAVALR